jgi:hypothetical protein
VRRFRETETTRRPVKRRIDDEMKIKKSDRELLWAEAKRRCHLSDEALRMAQEMGLNPRSLIKNRPSRSEPWKGPVEDWVRDMHEKRHRQKAGRRTGTPDST